MLGVELPIRKLMGNTDDGLRLVEEWRARCEIAGEMAEKVNDDDPASVLEWDNTNPVCQTAIALGFEELTQQIAHVQTARDMADRVLKKLKHELGRHYEAELRAEGERLLRAAGREDLIPSLGEVLEITARETVVDHELN